MSQTKDSKFQIISLVILVCKNANEPMYVQLWCLTFTQMPNIVTRFCMCNIAVVSQEKIFQCL